MSAQSKAIRSKTGVRSLYKKFKSEHARNLQLSFLLQDWEDAYNVGGMFRVADACGATELFMSGRTPVPPDPMIGVTSLGHHRRIPFHHAVKHEDAAQAARSAGYTLVAVEISENAVDYTTFSYPEKLCLVLGNEATGVYGTVLRQCEGAVFIPQFGKGRSMNVHVAAAIVAFRALLP